MSPIDKISDIRRLPRLGINAIDVAAAAPFLVLLIAPRLRVAPPLAGGMAAVLVLGLAWAARVWLPHA